MRMRTQSENNLETGVGADRFTSGAEFQQITVQTCAKN